MRLKPYRLFVVFLCSTRAAVFRRGSLPKRDGSLDEVKQAFGGDDDGRKTVTETMRQTITVNSARAVGAAVSQTATETVTVAVKDNGQLHNEEFEGLRLSFVTQTRTVVATQPAVTTTIVGNASTVTLKAPAETVTQIMTAPCQGGTNVPPGTPGTTIGTLLSSAPEVVINPEPNADGNGIGVSTVPIPESELPKTTLSYDPLASQAGVPPGFPAPPSTTEAAPTSQQPPVASQPTQSQVLTASVSSEAAPSETDSAQGEPANKQSDNGGNAPDDTAPVDSAAIESPEVPKTTQTSEGAPTPDPPSIDLSSFSLKSQLDLGNLARRTEVSQGQPTGVA